MPRVTITVPDRTPQPYRFPLDSGVVRMGRGSENDIVIECGSVSVKHAEMHRVPGGYELRDCGSTNGIKRGGVRGAVFALEDGTRLLLGDVAFDFVLSEEERAALAAEPAARSGPGLPPLPAEAFDDATPTASPPAAIGRPIPPRAQVIHVSGGAGFGSVLLFVVLALAAFFAGLSVRYEKETGKSLLKAMQARFTVPVAAPGQPAQGAPPAPAAPAAPAAGGEAAPE
jgi:hypothetical protein